MDIAQSSLSDTLSQFRVHHLEGGGAGDLPASDVDYFDDLVRGVVAQQGEIDRAIRDNLLESWRLSRLDRTLRAILRCGAYEVLFTDASLRMLCNEYTTIAHSFFDGGEGGMTNAILERLMHMRDKVFPEASSESEKLLEESPEESSAARHDDNTSNG